MSNTLTGKQIREKRKRLKLSVEALSERLEISKDNLYKWEKGTRITDVDAYLKLERWHSSELENVPRETGNVSKNAPVSDSRAIYGHLSEEASLSSLIEINRNLSLAQRTDAESRKELIRQNERLAKMLEDERAINSNARQEIELSHIVGFSQILEQLALVGVRVGLYRSLDEAADILNIPLGNLAKNVVGKRARSHSVNKKT